MTRPGRSIVAIGAGVIVLVALAIIVALVAGSPEVEAFPPGSPEATLQAYLQAVEDGDAEQAYDYLSSRAQSQMSFTDFQRFIGFGGIPRDARVRIDRTQVDDDRATLYLVIEHFSGSGIDFNRYSYEREVRLVREDDAWKIDEPLTGL